MAITTDDIQAAAPAAPQAQPAPAEAAPAPEGGDKEASIPDDVLRIPAFNALLEGKPGAIFAPNNQQDPDISTILKHGQELIHAGFAFYRAKSMPVNLIYNRLFLDDKQIADADAKGELSKIAEPFNEVRDSYEALRKKPAPGAAPGAASTPDATVAPAPSALPASPAPAGAPAPASVQNKITTARLNAISPGAPNGVGRVLSAIQKPVV